MESGWPGCSPECSSIGARGIRDGLAPLHRCLGATGVREDLGSLGVFVASPKADIFGDTPGWW